MIQRCILFAFYMIGVFSCNVKENNIDYEKFEVFINNSTRINESKGFFHKPEKVQLVSDSIIVAFSGFSGVSIYSLTGDQLEFIDPKKHQKRVLFFSSFDASDFPNIYFLEAKQNKVYVYNFDSREFIDEIALHMEEGTSIRAIGGKFKSHNKQFYIELNPEGTPMLDPDYYKNSGAFLGVFDSEGALERRVIEYPSQLVNPKGYFVPANYYSFDIVDDKLYICFPFEKIIRVYNIKSDFSGYDQITFPEPEYMELDLINIPNKFHPQEISVENRQISARVNDLIVQNSNLYLSFALNDNKYNDRYRVYTSVFKLDMAEMKWLVQRDPIDYFDIGVFAGVLNEDLVYVDASVVIKDDKFINKAVVEKL